MFRGFPSLMAGGTGLITGGTIYVQKGTYISSSDSTTHTVSFSSAPTSGHLLILIANCDSTITTPSGWTSQVSLVNNCQSTIYSKISAGTETSVTVTIGASTDMVMAIYEFTTYTAIDKTVTASFGNTTSFTIGPTATTTAANELLVAVVGIAISGSAPGPFISWSNGFVQDIYIFNTAASVGAKQSLAVAFQQVTSTGAYSTTVVWTNASSSSENGLIATFK
jgi:hypothetical protein